MDRCYHIRGSGGDTYTVACKLYGLKCDVRIVHTVARPDYWEELIRSIYSLVPCVKKVDILDKTERERIDSTIPVIDTRPYPVDVESDPEGIEMNWFPEFDFGPGRKDLPFYSPYKVIAPYAGGARNWGMHDREITSEEVKKIHTENDPQKSVVLCGHEIGLPPEKSLIDMSGQTDIMEAFSLIRNAQSFFGVQGLLFFVALSQKIESVGYVKQNFEEVVREQRIVGEWKKFCRKLEVFD